MKKLLKTILLVGAMVAAMSTAVTLPARALVEIDVNKGNVEPLPIAITDFLAGDALGAEIANVVAADLKRSGLFAPIDKGAFIEKISNPDVAPRFEDWKVINAQALVTGRVTQEADGRVRAEFRLWDTFAGQQLVGEQFFATKANWRRVAHIIADAIYERLTGEKGYFDTRIVFVDEIGRQGPAQEAAGDHGPGRCRPALSVRRIVDRAHAPVLAEPAGNHLHVLRERAAAGLPAADRDRPARAGRQLPRHDVRTAVLARRPAGDHEPAARRRQFQHLRHGPEEPDDHPAHQLATRSTPRLPTRRTAARSCSPPTAAAAPRST